MNCGFVDSGTDFFSLLSSKLGGSIEFCPLDPEDEAALLACDVVAVQVPSQSDPGQRHAMALLERYTLNAAGVPVIAFLPAGEPGMVREVMAAGVYDHVVESSSVEELRIVLRRAAQFYTLNRELGQLRSARQSPIFSTFNSSDPGVIAACSLAAKVADSDATILITGETGTGKELMARAIHDSSSRTDEAFVAVSCSSLPETLIESELFGHEKGAFTGAIARREGRFEAAGRGTLFLDEIGELSPSLQVKLLRVLQERTFERLGSSASRPLEARIICATNRDLKAAVAEGTFRADLYFRVNTISVHLPPLRERREDIVLLSLGFLRRYAERHGRRVARFRLSALKALKSYSWPGNVRELQHVVERSVLVCDGSEIGIEHLPAEFSAWETAPALDSLEYEVKSHKRKVIERALRENQYNKVRTARALGISRAYLHRLISELGLISESI